MNTWFVCPSQNNRAEMYKHAVLSPEYPTVHKKLSYLFHMNEQTVADFYNGHDEVQLPIFFTNYAGPGKLLFRITGWGVGLASFSYCELEILPETSAPSRNTDNALHRSQRISRVTVILARTSVQG